MVKKGLGRGLDILIPINDVKSTIIPDVGAFSDTSVCMLPVSHIVVNRYQPRREFSADKLSELVASIREKGVIQPILVHEYDGHYEIIAGERRWRAALELGLNEIPVIIRKVSDVELLELSLIENIQREDLNAIEEALAYQQLITEFNLRQEDVAVKVGKDRSSISNILRLLKLPSEIQDALISGILTMGHARALLALSSQEEMLKLAKKIMKDGLSVRETENLVKELTGFGKIKKSKTKSASFEKNSYVVAIEEELKNILGTKVQIKKTGKRKIIEIEYYSDDDLARLLSTVRKDSVFSNP